MCILDRLFKHIIKKYHVTMCCGLFVFFMPLGGLAVTTANHVKLIQGKQFDQITKTVDQNAHNDGSPPLNKAANPSPSSASGFNANVERILENQKRALNKAEKQIQAMKVSLQQLRARSSKEVDHKFNQALDIQLDSLKKLDVMVISIKSQTSDLLQNRVPLIVERIENEMKRKWDIIIKHVAVPVDSCSQVKSHSSEKSIQEFVAEGADLKDLCQQASIPDHHSKGACIWLGRSDNDGVCKTAP